MISTVMTGRSMKSAVKFIGYPSGARPLRCLRTPRAIICLVNSTEKIAPRGTAIRHMCRYQTLLIQGIRIPEHGLATDHRHQHFHLLDSLRGHGENILSQDYEIGQLTRL